MVHGLPEKGMGPDFLNPFSPDKYLRGKFFQALHVFFAGQKGHGSLQNAECGIRSRE
jgi:hypothetical protein